LEGYLFHVGADTTRLKETVGISSPLLRGRRFEFIPIVEWYPGECRKNTSESRSYEELRCHEDPSKPLLRFLPESFDASAVPHLDPDVENFTYGEPTHYCDRNGRKMRNPKAEVLRKLVIKRDFLFFAASLAPFPSKGNRHSLAEIAEFQKGRRAKYVIGYFRVRGLFEVTKCRNARAEVRSIGGSNIAQCEAELRENAHYKRSSGRFICAVGEKRRGGMLLRGPIQITKTQEGFKLNQNGLHLLNREYGHHRYTRGVRHLDSEAVGFLLDRLRVA
jgi:hypothetical protein